MVNDTRVGQKEKTKEKQLIPTEKKNQKIPKEISQPILKKMFQSLLKAVCIILYFIALNLAYTTMKEERLILDIKIFSGVFLVVGIYFLEKAYKEDNGLEALNGIEFLVLSLHSLSIMHIITLFEYDFRLYLLTSSYLFSIYFVLKAIILYTKGRREYLQGLSDISEIVKKEEPPKKEAKRRMPEEMEKRVKHKRQKEEERNLTAKRKKKKKVASSQLSESAVRTKKEEIKRPVKKIAKVKEIDEIEEPEEMEEKRKKTATKAKTTKPSVTKTKSKTVPKKRTAKPKEEDLPQKRTKRVGTTKKETEGEKPKTLKPKKPVKKKENE